MEVPAGQREGLRDAFRPLDGQAVGAFHEIIKHQACKVTGVMKPVGIKVNQLAIALVEAVEIKGRAGDGLSNAPSLGEPPDQRGFSHAKIAVEGEGDVGWHKRCQGAPIADHRFGGVYAYPSA